MEYKKFRYDFSDNIVQMLGEFANENIGKSRKEFMNRWEEYIAEEGTRQKIEYEKEMMIQHGFSGDVMDKMYKSVRYYHVKRDKKKFLEEDSINKYKHENRFSREFLKIMDEYIYYQLTNPDNIYVNENGIQINTVSQSGSYKKFCENNRENILEEFIKIKNKTGPLTGIMVNKLRKTYKTRFYKCRKI